MGCVKSLMNRAKNIRCGINENRTVRSARKKRRNPEQSGNRGKKLRTRCRFSPKNPEKALNPKRLHTNAQHDFCTRRNAKDRRTCSWCAYTKACNIRDGEDHYKPTMTASYCSYCGDTICKRCWNEFHGLGK